MRNLAHRAGDAAMPVGALISEANPRVDRGSTQIRQAQARIGEVLSSVAQMAQMASVLASISRSSQEPQSGISQESEAVTHLKSLILQKARLVEQLVAPANSGTSQGEAVESSMQMFRLRPSDLTLTEQDAVSMRRVHTVVGADHNALNISADLICSAPGTSRKSTHITVGSRTGCAAPVALPPSRPVLHSFGLRRDST